jgi:hypothetical protein
MKLVLAISTALLALGPTSGERKAGKLESTTYKYTSKSLSVVLAGSHASDDVYGCRYRSFYVTAAKNLTRNNANGRPTPEDGFYLYYYEQDFCNGNDASSWRSATLAPTLVLTGSARTGVELTAGGMASGEDCPYGSWSCTPAADEFKLRATLTPKALPTTLHTNTHIFNPVDGFHSHSQLQSAYAPAEYVLAGSALPPLLPPFEFDYHVYAYINSGKSGTMTIDKPSEA